MLTLTGFLQLELARTVSIVTRERNFNLIEVLQLVRSLPQFLDRGLGRRTDRYRVKANPLREKDCLELPHPMAVNQIDLHKGCYYLNYRNRMASQSPGQEECLERSC